MDIFLFLRYTTTYIEQVPSLCILHSYSQMSRSQEDLHPRWSSLHSESVIILLSMHAAEQIKGKGIAMDTYLHLLDGVILRVKLIWQDFFAKRAVPPWWWWSKGAAACSDFQFLSSHRSCSFLPVHCTSNLSGKMNDIICIAMEDTLGVACVSRSDLLFKAS